MRGARFWGLCVLLCVGVPTAVADEPEPYRRPSVHCVNDDATRAFDQALRQFYAFHVDDALAGFRRAASLDPDCAMAHFGIALSLGQHRNNPIVEAGCRPACGGPRAPNRDRPRRGACQRAQEPSRERAPEAHAAIGRALALAVRRNAVAPVDRDLIIALSARTIADPEAARTPLLVAHLASMRAIVRSYPDDPDVATLHALAIIDVHEAEFTAPGPLPAAAAADLGAARRALEAALAHAPDHPGAAHVYLHLIERTSRTPLADAVADRVAALAQLSGHMAHLPAHLRMHSGQWDAAADALRAALAADEAAAKAAGQPAFQRLYRTHEHQMLWQAEMMRGDGPAALAAARALVGQALTDVSPMLEHMLDGIGAAPGLTMVRFGLWDQALTEPAPGARQTASVALWHFARGLALVRKGKLAEAEGELNALRSAEAALGEVGPGARSVRIAARLLDGELVGAKGAPAQAIARLREAAQIEDGASDALPREWPLPARQFLGALLLGAGRSAEAETAYREDLARNPENGWSLRGLARSLEARALDASAVEERLQRVWRGGDSTLSSSRF